LHLQCRPTRPGWVSAIALGEENESNKGKGVKMFENNCERSKKSDEERHFWTQ